MTADGSIHAVLIQPGTILMVHLQNVGGEPIAQEVEQFKVQTGLPPLEAFDILPHLPAQFMM